MKNFDIAVIGAGPGGYVAAIRAAQLGKKVICIDKRKELGGTCLNVGCIPSKALLQSTEHYSKAANQFKEQGITFSSLNYDLKQMMKRKDEILSSFNVGIAGLFKKNKITHLQGVAAFINPTTLSVTQGSTSQEIQARHILLATGSEPLSLPFLPFNEKTILSSTGALALESVPKRLLVIGAGVIGAELGSVYARLGAKVSFIEFFPRICPTLDESLSKELLACLQRQGMKFHLSSKVTAATMTEQEVTLSVTSQEGAVTQMNAEAVLICIGRKPYTQGLELEKAGVALTDKGFVKIDAAFQTSAPSVFAIGDLIEGPMLAHKASEEGICVAEILAGKKPRLDYASIPNVVYTDPEVASVGLTEQEATQAQLEFNTGTFAFKSNSRARCAHEEEGFVKILADKKQGRLLGVHILGAHASELIAEGVLALHQRLTVHDLIDTPHAHPTLSEALKEAALAVENRALHK